MCARVRVGMRARVRACMCNYLAHVRTCAHLPTSTFVGFPELYSAHYIVSFEYLFHLSDASQTDATTNLIQLDNQSCRGRRSRTTDGCARMMYN